VAPGLCWSGAPAAIETQQPSARGRASHKSQNPAANLHFVGAAPPPRLPPYLTTRANSNSTCAHSKRQANRWAGGCSVVEYLSVSCQLLSFITAPGFLVLWRRQLLWRGGRDAERREPFALRSSYFVDELTDDLSIVMVKRIQNRYGVEIWPWERAGFTRSRWAESRSSLF